MGTSTPSRGGNKHRKFGRAARRPSHHRYNLEERWDINKERRIAKQAKKEAKQKERKLNRQKKD